MSSTSSPVSSMTADSDPDFTHSPPSPPTEWSDDIYRLMVRQLLARYRRRDIDKLLEEEDDAEDAPSSELSFGRCQPSAGHTDGHAGRQASSQLGLPLSSPLHDLGNSSSKSCERLTDPRADYACGFCAEIGITKTCTRRNDLRRHIDQFHNTNAQWLCQHPGCHAAFDWQTAYQLHLRSQHGGSQMRMDDAKMLFCPQTVFACGYQGCHLVLEAADDTMAADTWKTYTSHLIKHCEDGRRRGSPRWTYSHRMRNLLSQTCVSPAWSRRWPEVDVLSLFWDPTASRVLRKLLETRHLDSLPILLDNAVYLGSKPLPETLSENAQDLELPFRSICPGALSQHQKQNGFENGIAWYPELGTFPQAMPVSSMDEQSKQAGMPPTFTTYTLAPPCSQATASLLEFSTITSAPWQVLGHR